MITMRQGKKYLAHEASLRDEEGFIHHGRGDWGNPEHALLRENVETAFLYADSKTMAYFAGIGGTEEQAEFTELAEEIKANYNEKLLVQHPQDGYWYYQAWDHKDEICMHAGPAAAIAVVLGAWFREDKVEDVVRTFRLDTRKKKVCSSAGRLVTAIYCFRLRENMVIERSDLSVYHQNPAPELLRICTGWCR